MGVSERALELFHDAVGTDKNFRPDQLESILALVDDRARVLVVQRTGWGKSIVYFIATALLREAGAGPTILISPLLSLVRDQLLAAHGIGLRATTINSTNPEEWEEIETAIAADAVDLLLISPERLANNQFINRTLSLINKGIGMLVIDEAHCVSDWGHDFRPDYQRIKRIVSFLPTGVPLLATTATATDRVIEDVREQLGADMVIYRGSLARDSLYFQVITLGNQAERLAWLAQYLGQVSGSGIIYTLTVQDARRVSEWLFSQGFDAPAYYAKADNRPGLEKQLRDNECKALVSTIALGMGFDKPDLAFVVHFQRPSSVIAYYQQVGRAGRSIQRAEAVLLLGEEDARIHEGFRNGALPPEEHMNSVLQALEQVDETTVPALERRLNMSKGEIEHALKFLHLDGAAATTSTAARWARTPNPWTYDQARSEQLQSLRLADEERMIAYAETTECYMEFLAIELNDSTAVGCGQCANCAAEFASSNIDTRLLDDAVLFLRRGYMPIEPRRQWPPGITSPSRIPPEHQLEEGRVLCRYGDAGWGTQVRDGKYVDDGFSDELVSAVAEMMRAWAPEPKPTWVSAIPSRRDPERVPDFARRLADHLGLQYADAIIKIRDTDQQKSMQNSFHQAQNVYGLFEAIVDQVRPGPVLLVDDMVDSRWSMTACGVVLREAGSGPVFPVALAKTTRGDE